MDCNMSILAIGDPHIRRNTIPRSLEMTRSIIREAEKRRPRFIVILGDILDRFGDARMEAHCLSIDEFISPLVDIAHVYVIMGNHDRNSNSDFLSKKNFYRALRRWNGATLVDEVINDTVDGVQFTFCPYVPDGRFIEALNTKPGWEKSRMIFCHQAFRGAKMGPIPSRTGDVWSPDKLPVVSGHVHDHCKLQCNILYVGASDHLSYGDDGTKTISMLHLQGEDMREERIDLGLPKWIHIHIKSVEVPYYTPPEEGMIKITVTGTVPENAAVKKLDCIKQWKARGIVVKIKDILAPKTSNFMIIEDDEPRPKKKNFIDGLYDEVKDDPEGLEAFCDVFGRTPM